MFITITKIDKTHFAINIVLLDKIMGKVVKVENFSVESLFGHGVLMSKRKLELNVDTFDKGC